MRVLFAHYLTESHLNLMSSTVEKVFFHEDFSVDFSVILLILISESSVAFVRGTWLILNGFFLLSLRQLFSHFSGNWSIYSELRNSSRGILLVFCMNSVKVLLK